MYSVLGSVNQLGRQKAHCNTVLHTVNIRNTRCMEGKRKVSLGYEKDSAPEKMEGVGRENRPPFYLGGLQIATGPSDAAPSLAGDRIVTTSPESASFLLNTNSTE